MTRQMHGRGRVTMAVHRSGRRERVGVRIDGFGETGADQQQTDAETAPRAQPERAMSTARPPPSG